MSWSGTTHTHTCSAAPVIGAGQVPPPHRHTHAHMHTHTHTCSAARWYALVRYTRVEPGATGLDRGASMRVNPLFCSFDSSHPCTQADIQFGLLGKPHRYGWIPFAAREKDAVTDFGGCVRYSRYPHAVAGMQAEAAVRARKGTTIAESLR